MWWTHIRYLKREMQEMEWNGVVRKRRVRRLTSNYLVTHSNSEYNRAPSDTTCVRARYTVLKERNARNGVELEFQWIGIPLGRVIFVDYLLLRLQWTRGLYFNVDTHVLQLLWTPLTSVLCSTLH